MGMDTPPRLFTLISLEPRVVGYFFYLRSLYTDGRRAVLTTTDSVGVVRTSVRLVAQNI